MREILFMQKGRDSHCSDKEKKGEERKYGKSWYKRLKYRTIKKILNI